MTLEEAQLETIKALRDNIDAIVELQKAQQRNIELIQEEIECIKDPKHFPAKATAWWLGNLLRGVK